MDGRGICRDRLPSCMGLPGIYLYSSGQSEDVVVASAYRGRGIGRTLLQRILDFAGSKLSPIDPHLTSNPSRVEANALYQALGFEQRETNVYKMSL